jgi:L-ascorbate metabolism protein UlaG (beta-lactamase superfamily)
MTFCLGGGKFYLGYNTGIMNNSKERWARPLIHKGKFYHDSCDSRRKSILVACIQLISSLAREFSIVCISFIRRLKTAAATRNLHALYRPKRLPKKTITQPSAYTIEPRITWIGHASFLIQINGITIISDPIFGQPSFLFPRITPPGIALNELPPINYIIISHNHWDHMHAPSLMNLLKKNPLVHALVPVGTGTWFTSRGFLNVTEHTWWQTTSIEKYSLNFTFTPARHWSQRNPFDRNSSLWGSWMIEHTNTTIYFAGDTAYDTHFHAIAKQFPSIDIALMPIGPCEPRRWMCHSHISAEEAGEAFNILNAQHFIPMHWGTFYFGIDHLMTPVERLNTWWNTHTKKLIGKQLHILGIGQSFENTSSINKIQRNTKSFSRSH